MLRLTSIMIVWLAACGGSDKPDAQMPANEEPMKGDGEHATGEHGEHGEHADGEGKHHFPGDVNAFHELLSPLWHAEPGQARTTDTCAATASLSAAAMKIAEGPVPTEATDGAAFAQAAEGLVAATTDLETTCGDPERLGMFEGGFKDVHDAFHALASALGKH